MAKTKKELSGAIEALKLAFSNDDFFSSLGKKEEILKSYNRFADTDFKSYEDALKAYEAMPADKPVQSDQQSNPQSDQQPKQPIESMLKDYYGLEGADFKLENLRSKKQGKVQDARTIQQLLKEAGLSGGEKDGKSLPAILEYISELEGAKGRKKGLEDFYKKIGVEEKDEIKNVLGEVVEAYVRDQRREKAKPPAMPKPPEGGKDFTMADVKIFNDLSLRQKIADQEYSEYIDLLEDSKEKRKFVEREDYEAGPEEKDIENKYKSFISDKDKDLEKLDPRYKEKKERLQERFENLLIKDKIEKDVKDISRGSNWSRVSDFEKVASNALGKKLLAEAENELEEKTESNYLSKLLERKGNLERFRLADDAIKNQQREEIEDRLNNYKRNLLSIAGNSVPQPLQRPYQRTYFGDKGPSGFETAASLIGGMTPDLAKLVGSRKGGPIMGYDSGGSVVDRLSKILSSGLMHQMANPNDPTAYASGLHFGQEQADKMEHFAEREEMQKQMASLNINNKIEESRQKQAERQMRFDIENRKMESKERRDQLAEMVARAKINKYSNSNSGENQLKDLLTFEKIRELKNKNDAPSPVKLSPEDRKVKEENDKLIGKYGHISNQLDVLEEKGKNIKGGGWRYNVSKKSPWLASLIGVGNEEDINVFDKVAADLANESSSSLGRGVGIVEAVQKTKPSRSIKAIVPVIHNMKKVLKDDVDKAYFVNEQLEKGLSATQAHKLWSERGSDKEDQPSDKKKALLKAQLEEALARKHS